MCLEGIAKSIKQRNATRGTEKLRKDLKRGGGNEGHLKRLLAVEEVVLSAELAELLRHRELTWSLILPVARTAVPDAEGDFETGHGCDERGDERTHEIATTW